MTQKRIAAAQTRALCGDISDMTLWRWLNERDFPKPIYIARRRFWREADVLAWLDSQDQHRGAA
jgi:predicted DNA-binding transcriptional regulator AlpA